MTFRERFFNLWKYERMIADLAELHDGVHEYSSSTAALQASTDKNNHTSLNNDS